MDPDPNSSRILLQLLVLLVLTLINAFFSGSEMAVVSVNKVKIHQLAKKGNKNAVLIEKLMKDSTVFLSTIQVAITLAGFFSSASAATGIAAVLGKKLKTWGVPYGQQIASGGITIILAYFNLVLGELVPKKIALQKAEKFSLICVRPIYYLSKIINPFIKFLSFSTRTFLKMFHLYSEKIEEKVSEEEIKALLKSGNTSVNSTEREIISSVFSFNDKSAREIMIPRQEVVAVDINDPISKNLDIIFESHHSKIPVYSEREENIIGVVSAKEIIIQARKTSFDSINLSEMLEEPFFVPETRRTDMLFRDMKENKKKAKIAILIDEYGVVSGIVTLRDLIEEIVGDIQDEYDEEEPEIKKLSDGTFDISGGTALFDLNEELNLHIDSECDTLSGFLIEHLGFIPEENQLPRTVETEEADFVIKSLNGKIIDRVRVIKKEKIENSELA